MKIIHIALSVKDLEKSVDFYKQHFGFKEIKRFTKPRWDGSAVILSLGDLQLEIFKFQNSIDKKDDLSDLKVIGLKHFAIQVGNIKKNMKN